MRKRAVSAALAVLLAMSLGIPAFADAEADGEEDLFATSLELARCLEQAPGVASVSYVELSGTVDGGEETDVDVELDFAESAYQDGYRLTMAEYDAYDPVESYQAAAVVADESEVYFVTASDIYEEDLSVTRYEAVSENAFSDMSGLSAYFAALGNHETDAAVQDDEALAYETTGAEVRELLVICCPKLVEGYEDLDWDGIPAQVWVEFYDDPFGASVTITSSQLGEAMLRSLDGEAAVTDVEFTAELDILGTEDDGDDYDEYRVTAQDIKEEAEMDEIQIEDREGESPACGTAKDFLRTVCSPTR